MDNDSSSSIWEEIELSESYLVCSMYEEAATLATSVLERVCKANKHDVGNGSAVEGSESLDVMESAGMVLVQSLHLLRRTSEIMDELKRLFVAFEAIPVQVLCTGACFQISESSYLGVHEILEEFLRKWSRVDERCYVLVNAEVDMDGWSQTLEVTEYVEVVEVYVSSLLCTDGWDQAVSWVERLHCLKRHGRYIRISASQALLRRLNSYYSAKASTPLSSESPNSPENSPRAYYSLAKEPKPYHESRAFLKPNSLPDGGNDKKQGILKFSASNSFLQWSPSLNLKFRGVRLAVTNTKILLGCLIFLMFLVVQRKRATLNGVVKRQVYAVKKALVDLWHLASSYQVNPLAAVQPLSNTTRGW